MLKDFSHKLSSFNGQSSSDEGSLEFEFRPQYRHHPPIFGATVTWVLVGVAIFAFLGFVGWSLHDIFPNLTWSDMPRVWAYACDHLGLWGWDRRFLFLFWVVVLGFHYLWPRHLRLDISVQGIRQTHRLPLGLHHLFGQSWSAAWTDVRSIQVRQRTVGSHVQAMALVEVVLTLSRGRVRVIRPAFWFRSGDPPRPRLRPLRDGLVFDVNPWVRPAFQAVVAEHFGALPVVKALNQFGAAHHFCVAWTTESTQSMGSRWSDQPQALVLFGGALLLFVMGFVLMVAQPTLHLADSLTWGQRLGVGVGSLMLITLVLWAVRIGLARSTTNSSMDWGAVGLSALLWVCAVGFMAEPLLVHLSRWGLTDQAVVNVYVVKAGYVVPVSPNEYRADGTPRSLPIIALPGEYSRLSWLRDDTQISITSVPGRWGIWSYDDSPLRSAADQQGIR